MRRLRSGLVALRVRRVCVGCRHERGRGSVAVDDHVNVRLGSLEGACVVYEAHLHVATAIDEVLDQWLVVFDDHL